LIDHFLQVRLEQSPDNRRKHTPTQIQQAATFGTATEIPLKSAIFHDATGAEREMPAPSRPEISNRPRNCPETPSINI
jgi:hypothetical protein